MTLIEAAKLARDALKVSRNTLNASRNWLQHRHDVTHDAAIAALDQAFAEIDSYRSAYPDNFIQHLTDAEIVKITSDPCLYIRGEDYIIVIARAIEAAHGIKE